MGFGAMLRKLQDKIRVLFHVLLCNISIPMVRFIPMVINTSLFPCTTGLNCYSVKKNSVRRILFNVSPPIISWHRNMVIQDSQVPIGQATQVNTNTGRQEC